MNKYIFLKFKIILHGIIQKKITIKKLWNTFVCFFSYFFKLKLSGRTPILVSIDLWNECNENCVFCRSSKGEIYNLNKSNNDEFKFIPKGKLELQTFKNIVNEICDTSVMIIPYINGEPLMYKDIYSAINYANNKKLLTLIASNGILLNERNSEKLITSGLDFLKVHTSGFSNEIHSIQHRKGNAEKIYENLKRFTHLKKKLKSKVILMLDYILYNHNKHELQLAKNFADENEILFNIRPGNPFGMEGTENTQPAKDMKKQACDWPWKAVSINWDGSVIPCCEYVVWKGASPHKNYSEQNLLKTWNGSSYIYFRKEHTNNGRVNLEVCKDCPRQGLGFKF